MSVQLLGAFRDGRNVCPPDILLPSALCGEKCDLGMVQQTAALRP